MRTALLIALVACTVGATGAARAPPHPAAASRSQAPAVDAFGTRNIYPSAPGGHSWHAKWDASPRVLGPGDGDPLDPEFSVRGDQHFLEIKGNGTAKSYGDIIRFYVTDPSGAKRWRDVEITLYGRRVAERGGATSASGFSFQARTGAGHTSAAVLNANGLPIQCDGHSYGLSFRANGEAVLEKELKHPYYTKQVSTNVWGGAAFPKGRWVGMKAVVFGIDGGRNVKLELWRDLTDGKEGGSWEKVLEHTDSGGWGVDPAIAASCKIPYDHVITTAEPAIVLRNDKVAEQWLKKFTVREIRPGILARSEVGPRRPWAPP